MEISKKLKEIITNLFDLREEQFSIDLDYETVKKWDSIGHMNLMTEIESSFNIDLDVSEIMEMSSVRKIVEVLKAKHDQMK